MNDLEYNPSDFCETYLGIKLNKWQKLIINSIKKNETLIVNYPPRNGRFMTNIMVKILYNEQFSQEELDWCKQNLSEEVYNNLLDTTNNL